ncbi:MULTISPECIES: hypothetical protein [unclassified Anaeromyxobacter]|uniref:hypothetical protein n=1 Tax=unclassified Anaeromyxobacter TaxID=2620896 RepID=UPI001F55DEA6|nr:MULTISPECIES: hypothetical protein [unclassified Anaeromyxobacter]
MRSLARAAVVLVFSLALTAGAARAKDRPAPRRTGAPAREAPRASGQSAPEPAPAPGASGSDVVRLRFAWPAAAEVQATQRRTRHRTGLPPSTTITRFTQRLEQAGGALRISTRGTSWEGDAPYPGPPAAVDGILRAAESVVQVVSPEGEFVALEGVEALRPGMARMLEGSVPDDQRERALAFAEAATQAQAREMWNLAVGFWIGADLELGERYGMRTEAEVPLLGTRADFEQEFSVRRRVPCSARDHEERCVEITLRAAPDPAALPGLARAVVAKLAGPEARLPEDALRELVVENELVLVTEPATLLPHRFVWTRSVRATVAEGGGEPRVLEQVERSESDYQYGAPARKKPARKAKRTAARG